MATVHFTLGYTGRRANNNEIDFYDVSQALIGFQRSLALTTHLVLNDEVITQAPSLKGADIFALPASAGSWKLPAAVVVSGALWKAGTAPKDTPLGNLISSAYDYVISESLGFHVDYNKTLGQQYQELKSKENLIKPLPQSRFDSVIEKCEAAIREMHRPIAKSETANKAVIKAEIGSLERNVGVPLTRDTYDYIAYTKRSSDIAEYVGRVSSYNINTFKGRIYVPEEGRPVPFELGDSARDGASVLAVVSSLSANANKRSAENADIRFKAFRDVSRSGRLKGFLITEIVE